MDLDGALLLMARSLDQGETEQLLTERARAGVVAALAGGEKSPDAVYQQMLGLVVVRTPDGDLAVRRERGAHRGTGAYYTVETVVRYMAEQARGYAPHAATVIDPSCGAGAFLRGAREAFGPALTELAGLDTDPIAADLCRGILPEASIRVSDALLEAAEGRFDLCLGNPPYISSGLRGAAAQEAQRQSALRLRYPHTGQYKLNTYPLFVELGLELLRPGGVLGYIVPDSFLTGRYFAGLRRLLLAHTLLELTLIRRDFWQHGRVGQSVILFVRKGAPPAGHQVAIKVCEDVTELASTPSITIPPEEFAWGALDRFRLVTEPGSRKFLRQMEEASQGAILGDYLRTYSGLIARSGQKSLLRSLNPAAGGPWGRLLRSGSEIDRYRLEWRGEEVSLDPALIKSGGQLAYYRAPKILLRQTADSLRAVCDEDGFFCLNNIHLLIPTGERVGLDALLGLINSAPVNRWYRSVTMELGRLYPQVDLDLVSVIPVPPWTDAGARELGDFVQKREKATPEEVASWEQRIDRHVESLYGLNR